jgi:ABC-2 type transport system permease protein
MASVSRPSGAVSSAAWIRGLDKYYSIFKTQLINAFAYPADLFSRVFSMLIFMWVFLQLWKVTYGAMGQEQIAGLTLRDTLWYLMIAETVMLSKPRLSRTIAENVKDGSVAYLLNKPYHFLLYQVSVGLGDSILRMVINALAGGAMIWLLLGPPPNWLGLPMVIVTLGFAWGIDFCLNAMIGLLAFLTEDVSAFEWIYSKFILILGGVLIPLDFFPEWLRQIALSLPFAYTTYAPARIFIDPGWLDFASLLLRQGAWLLVMASLLGLFFRLGVRRLNVNGG